MGKLFKTFELEVIGCFKSNYVKFKDIKPKLKCLNLFLENMLKKLDKAVYYQPTQYIQFCRECLNLEKDMVMSLKLFF